MQDGAPAPKFGIHILHHPINAFGEGANRLLWSIGRVMESPGAAPHPRWLHDANTDGGSSGAPIFDNNWKIVGLHQAGWKALSAHDQVNRAAPVRPWAAEIERVAAQKDETPSC